MRFHSTVQCAGILGRNWNIPVAENLYVEPAPSRQFGHLGNSGARMPTRYDLHWTVGHSKSPSELPTDFVAAVVPGAVQLDWARAKRWGPHFYGENFRAYAWMEDVYWTYRAPLTF